MTRDRLPELIENFNSRRDLHNEEFIIDAMETESMPINTILSQYGDIRILLAQIASNLETMTNMVQRTNLRGFNENEMDDLRNHNLKIGQNLMMKFKDLKNNLSEENDYSLEARMKRTLFYGLHQTYINIWNKNEAFLQSYEDKLKKNLQMHSKILNCGSTEEEVEELLANKTTSLYVGNILEEAEKERRTLRDLMERFSELKKLEKSIEDVHSLFIRIQNLVMEQNDRIQIVEYHAQQASLQVDKGAEELDKAHVLKRKTLRKKMILLITGTSILSLMVLLACT